VSLWFIPKMSYGGKMKAGIYYGEQKIKIEEADIPVPEPGYVLIQMKYCGICGSDLHSYFGQWGQSAKASGHETSGIIVKCGEGVADFKEGDRVCAECFSHCGKCRYCKIGQYNFCNNLRGTSGGNHSGFAEYIIAHSSSLFRFPDNMSYEDGAMIEPLAVSYRAFNRTEAGYQDNVLIIGSGTIGLLATASAKACGAPLVIATYKYDHQAKMALELGADAVIQSSDEGLIDKIMKSADAIDAIVETTASTDGFNLAMSVIRKGGSLVLVGGYHKALEVNLSRIVGGEIRVTGSSCYGYSGMKRDFEWSMDLIMSNKIPAGKLITNRIPLSNIEEAFKIAADKNSGSIKVLVYNDYS
jgi:2-desacetyl-2-hydroxyethyl bacteriochlorophyllide A dehydrogenase